MQSTRSRWVVLFTILVLSLAIIFAVYKQTKQPVGLNGLNPGDVPPNFTLQDVNGKNVSLSDFKGKVVMINVWASWCQPCRDEIPGIVDTYNKYKNQGFVVLGVDYKENLVTVKGFAEQDHMNYPILLDTNGKVADQYKVGPIPSSFIVNRKGTIQKVFIGQIPEKNLEKTISTMIKQ